MELPKLVWAAYKVGGVVLRRVGFAINLLDPVLKLIVVRPGGEYLVHVLFLLSVNYNRQP